MRLVFNIPTWNRPAELEVCVQSIASQVRDARTAIIICQDQNGDGEPNETTEVIQRLQAEYAFIKHVIHRPRSDYAANFRASWMAAEGDWTWTFGDDDILVKGALDFALDKLDYIHQKDGVQFIHIAERKRSGKSDGVYSGTLLDLCNQFGWIEMTGFITGNIIRTQPLANRLKLIEPHRQRIYARTAFWQSCALLEMFQRDNAALIDIPLIDSQNLEQTEATLASWKEQNIGVRYFYLADAIEVMVDDGILQPKLENTFFRYLEYHLWNRFLTNFVGEHLKGGDIFHDSVWAALTKFPAFLADREYADMLTADIDYARQMTTLSAYLATQREAVRGQLQEVLNKYDERCYPYHFGAPRQEESGAIVAAPATVAVEPTV